MVGLSNILLILASLADLTNAGLLDGLKPAGNQSNPAVRAAFEKFGLGLLSGLVTGVARRPAEGSVDPGLASVLSSFGNEFEAKTGTNSGGSGAEAGTAVTTAGSGGSRGEPDSSEEKTKNTSTNGGVGGGPPEKPASPGAADSGSAKPVQPGAPEPGSQPPQSPAPGQSGQGIPPKAISGVPCFPGTPGGEVARNVGAATGTIIATKLFGALMDVIKKAAEKKQKQKMALQHATDRREKRSLVDDMGLMGSKGALKGSNNVPGY